MMHIKVAVSFLFLAAGTVATLTMLYVMGRPEKKSSPETMRKTHKVMGIAFTVLLLYLAWIGSRFVGAMGDEMPLRAVFHVVFGVSIIAVLLMKLLIVRFYRGLMRLVPVMGLILFGLALVTFSISTGYHFARELHSGPSAIIEEDEGYREGEAAGTENSAEAPSGTAGAEVVVQAGDAGSGETMPAGDVKAGRSIFNNRCVGCHDPDSRKTLFGPGLLGLMKRETLRSSGEPPTPENVRNQIVNPEGGMPAFTTFSKKEMNDLLAYLGTL